MIIRDFWFVYRNILTEEFSKKKYLSFLRKIFGLFYKIILKILRHKFSINTDNLDKKNKKDFTNYYWDASIDIFCTILTVKIYGTW